jgi:hypothetical protein
VVLRELSRLPSGGCSLARWSGAGDRCRWCDGHFGLAGPLPGAANHVGREDPGGWCSVGCADAHHRNHWWDLARLTALARDDARCIECGRGPASVSEGKFLLRALISMSAVEAARLWSSGAWQRFALDCQVEVHHVVPRAGAGYGSGCHHHVDGLVTLCHRHHAEITAASGRVAAAG